MTCPVKPSRSEPPRRADRARGFTLIELLVVVAVLVILISILAPALYQARRAGTLAVCMSNLRQMTLAAASYTGENDQKWPFVPLQEPPLVPYVLFNSWKFGGATTDAYWQPRSRAGGVNYLTAKQRPLNQYMYPDAELDAGTGPRTDLPAYRCPSDPGTYQRGYFRTQQLDPSITSYRDVGTSYHQNVKWWFQTAPTGTGSLAAWRRVEPRFRSASYVVPSKFVWVNDQNMDYIANYNRSSKGDHGGDNLAAAAFMDGHVSYLKATPGATNTAEYQLEFLIRR